MFNGGGFGAALTAGLQQFNQARQQQQDEQRQAEQQAMQQQALARALARDRQQDVQWQVEQSRNLADTAAQSLAENPGQQVGESLRQLLHRGGREDMLAPSGEFDRMGDPLMVARVTPQQKASQEFQAIQQKLQGGAVKDLEKRQQYEQVLGQFMRDQPLDFKKREQLAMQMGQPLPDPDSAELDRRQDRAFAQQQRLMNTRVHGTGLLKPAQRYGLVSKANNDFNRNTKDAQTVLGNLDGINRAWNQFQESKDPAQLRAAVEQVVVGMFGKTVDPLSAVREGEYARTFGLAPAIDRFNAYFARVQQGGQVPLSTLQGLVDAANEIAKPAESYMASERDRILSSMPEGIGPDEVFGKAQRGMNVTRPQNIAESGAASAVTIPSGPSAGKTIPIGTLSKDGKRRVVGVNPDGTPITELVQVK